MFIIPKTLNIYHKTNMILKNTGSRIFVINLFADFILSKIPHNEETIIKVVDCVNFFIIKGKTTYNQVLDLTIVLEEFLKKYSNHLGKIKLSHTVDLIEYDVKMNNPKTFEFVYHNSPNCSYNHKQIENYENNKSSYDYNHIVTEITDEDMVSVSEFPYGHSLGQGRLHYYYGKHIFYSIPTNYPVNTLIFSFSKDKNEEGEPIFSVRQSNSQSIDKVLTSAILDVFDFDMSWMESKIKKVDWSLELLNPLEEYHFIKKINPNLIII
jgi:hypothetical protein